MRNEIPMMPLNRYQPNWLIRKLTSPWLIWNYKPGRKTIYLSFDDGPDAAVTPLVLTYLTEFDAKATFFICGEQAEKEPALVNSLQKNGHTLGNHTYNHLNGFNTSTKHYIDNIVACSKIVHSKLFRPPYGKIRPMQVIKLEDLGYRIIMWTVMSNDFDQSLDAEQCLQNTIDHTCDGSIILFHDSAKAAANMLYVLPRYLAHFKNLGYNFDAIH